MAIKAVYVLIKKVRYRILAERDDGTQILARAGAVISSLYLRSDGDDYLLELKGWKA